MKRLFQLGGFGCLAVSTMWLSGCAGSSFQQSAAPAADGVAGVRLQGSVHGGQQPITGAVIQLYAAGNSGYGSAAKALIPIADQVVYSGAGTGAMTDSNGGFVVTGDYTCPSPASQVYITATGGNPGLSGTVNNNGVSMMAALGSCGSLNSSSSVIINEISTVAAVWALQQFIGVAPGVSLASQPGINGSGALSTPAFSIGTSPSNAQGLATAFAMANLLVPFSQGVAPSSITSATSTTKYLPEYWQINLLGNILANCVNSNQSASSNCSTLFGATAKLSGSAPADTLQAAYAIASNPTYNVSTLFGLAAGSPPFAPGSSSVNDFTIAMTVTPSSTVGKYLNNTVDIAFDSNGNMWTSNTCHGSTGTACSPAASGGLNAGQFLSEFDGLGNPIGNLITGYNLGSISSPNVVAMSPSYTYNGQFTIAIDLQNNVWASDFVDGVIFEVPGSSAYGAAPGNQGSQYNLALSTGTSSGPTALAVDPNGTVWFAGWGNPATSSGVGTWASTNTFPTSNIKAYGGIAPGTSITSGGPLTGGFYASVSPGAQDTYNMVVDLTPASSYSGAPFVFGDDGSNFTYGQIHQLFSVAGTNPGTSSSTVVTQGQATPVSPFGASEISSSARKTSLADDAAVPYNGTNYVTYSTKNGKSEAIDGNNNLWILNGSAASATSGFPTFSLSKISPTYGIAPTTGALTATATSTVFTSASMNTYATGLLSFLKIDGGNNVWLGASSSTYGSWIEFTNSGAELSATSLGLGYVGSTGTGQTSIRGSAGHRANAIDASGNVWSSATNSNGDNLYVLIGQAVPTVAPLSQAVYNSQHNPTSTYGRVGTRP